MLVDVCHMCDTVNAEMLGYVVAGGGCCSTCRGRCQAREHSERNLTLSCLETLWSYTGIVWENSRTGVRPRGGSPTDLVKSCSCFTIILSFCSYWQYLCWNIYIIVCVSINYTPPNKISPPISLIKVCDRTFQIIALKQAFAGAVLSPI